ncbi:MAG: phosphoribosyltransferase family protein [Phycisphaerae bacterium]
MARDIGEVLIDADAIARRVRDLGRELADTYRGREPVLVAVMKGCVLFLADLVRAWEGPMDIEFVTAESYEGTEPGEVHLAVPDGFADRVAGRPVLVVDDIFDTGATLAAVGQALLGMGAEEVRSVVLLRKHGDTAEAAPRSSEGDPAAAPDWVGFHVPDRFVVGYGLDLDGRYRNLPYVAALRGE